MSRNSYIPKQTYIGDGTVALYSFTFKIEVNTQLEIIEVDATGIETQRVRGDDLTYLNNVTYDPTGEGGSVELASNLIAGRSLIILLANDAPTQPYEFSNKLSFNLKTIERALDFLGGAIQRLAYRGKQALRIHDSEDEETFDAQLPPDIAGNADRLLQINQTGDGFEYGPLVSVLEAAAGGSSVVTTDFDVTIPGNQGRHNNGDTVLAGTSLEQVIIDMLQLDAGPNFSLSGNGPFLVESGTSINPTLTPSYSSNDAGPSNAYSLFKNAGSILGPVLSPVPFNDPAYVIRGIFTYHATLAHDAGSALPSGNLISGNVVYNGARSGFLQEIDGDIVTIRNNATNIIGISNGQTITTATTNATPGVATGIVISYPDYLNDISAVSAFTGGPPQDITAGFIRETDQLVPDAGGDSINYKVYRYAPAGGWSNTYFTITL